MTTLVSCGENLGVRTGGIATSTGNNEQGFFPAGSASTLDATDSTPLKLDVADGLFGRKEFSEKSREFKTAATVRGFTDETNEFQSRKVLHRAVLKFNGETIFDETRRANAVTWNLPFEKEGNYELSFSAKLEVSELEVSQNAVIYRVDRTSPLFDSVTQVLTDLDSGLRNVRATISAAAQENIKCQTGWLFADPQSKERTKLSFEPVRNDSNSPKSTGGQAFRAEEYASKVLGIGALPTIWKETVFMEISCSDIAGNSSTRVLPLYSESHEGVYTAALPFGKAQAINGGAEMLGFLKSSNFAFKPIVLNKLTSLPANEEVQNRLSKVTKVVVSSAPVINFESAKDIAGAVTGDLNSDMAFSVPDISASSSEKTVYISFFEKSRDPAEGSLPLKFLSSERLSLRFDDKPLEYTWDSKTIRPVVAKKDEVISVGLRPVEGTYVGAPLHAFPKLEWTTNGSDWLTLEASDSKIGAQGELSAKIKYPFEKEQVFRVRAKVTDWAGNEFTSEPSPSLVYADNLQSKFEIDSSCQTKEDPKLPLAKPELVLASAYACKVTSAAGADGADTSAIQKWRIELFAVNKGQRPLELQNQAVGSGPFSNVSFLMKSGKETIVSPIANGSRSSGSSASSVFELSTLENLKPFRLEISEDELFSSGARIYFDAGAFENAGGYSFVTVPGTVCYQNSADQSFVLDGRPHLILNPVIEGNTEITSGIKRSPFPCQN